MVVAPLEIVDLFALLGPLEISKLHIFVGFDFTLVVVFRDIV